MAEQPAVEQPWPQAWMGDFLTAFRSSANVWAACRQAKVGRSTAYKARSKSARFRGAWDEAAEDAIDTLEAVAWKRAREQSDYLLWRLLAANRRDKYGDTVKVTLDLEAEARKIAEREGLTPDQAGKIVSLAARLQQGKTG